MKFRTNFVSNSSSSSFVCFIDRQVFDDLFEKWEPTSEELSCFEGKDLKTCIKRHLKSTSVFGRDVYEFSPTWTFGEDEIVQGVIQEFGKNLTSYDYVEV